LKLPEENIIKSRIGNEFLNNPINKWTNELDSSQNGYKCLINIWQIFHIHNHKRNASQNYTEISAHPSQNGYHQEKKKSKCWQGCGGK
jgi:hypothetical protein